LLKKHLRSKKKSPKKLLKKVLVVNTNIMTRKTQNKLKTQL
jgi:hypothetical protein